MAKYIAAASSEGRTRLNTATACCSAACARAPVEQVKASNDLIMPGKAYQINPNRKDEVEERMNAVKSGRLDERVLDASVKRILTVFARTPAFKSYRYSNQPDLEAHAQIAYEAAAEDVVLLKNNGALPLKEGSRVAVFGTGQIETVRGYRERVDLP